MYSEFKLSRQVLVSEFDQRFIDEGVWFAWYRGSRQTAPGFLVMLGQQHVYVTSNDGLSSTKLTVHGLDDASQLIALIARILHIEINSGEEPEFFGVDTHAEINKLMLDRLTRGADFTAFEIARSVARATFFGEVLCSSKFIKTPELPAKWGERALVALVMGKASDGRNLEQEYWTYREQIAMSALALGRTYGTSGTVRYFVVELFGDRVMHYPTLDDHMKQIGLSEDNRA
jgi:hypothetical protein